MEVLEARGRMVAGGAESILNLPALKGEAYLLVATSAGRNIRTYHWRLVRFK